MKNRKDVAALLGIEDRSLRYFLYKIRPENMYHTFEIPKKDGTMRKISAPDPRLREIQRKLAYILSSVYEPKICAYGFIAQKNIVGNAQKHINRRIVFNVDLKDFFSQIHFGRVSGMLMKPPYSIGKEAAIVIAQIACFESKLPQGAPSSPIISNMICAPMDNALMRLAKATSCVYTRYADDITFSTNKKELDRSIAYIDGENLCIGEKLQKIFKKNSFHANPQKTVLRNHTLRQEVTGLTVNEFPNLRRNYTKHLRAILHSCKKHGVVNAAKVYTKKGLCKNSAIIALVGKAGSDDKIINWFRGVLVGKVNYIKQVKGLQSYTYLFFARKINEVFEESIFDICELSRFDNTIKNSTFIIECKDKDEII